MKHSSRNNCSRTARASFWATALLITSAALAKADGVVVFNEIMYHPATNETTMEWLELHNQMSVNVDLSGWSITGGVNYSFTEGTVIPGGGYLVVTVSPSDLKNSSGITNIVGPYAGRLSNSGDTLKLRNKNNRIMDSVTYKVEGEWPAAPDGSGVSLAKRDENSASGTAGSWTYSAQIGGTPGKLNFPTQKYDVITTVPIAMQGVWEYATNAQPDWTTSSYDDTTWTSGSSPFVSGQFSFPSGATQTLTNVFNTGVIDSGTLAPTGSGDPHYVLTFSAAGTPPPPAVAATVMDNHSAWLANSSSSKWIGVVPSGYTSVAAGYYNFRTTFDLTGFSPATTKLKINVAADNRVDDIQINGVSTGFSYSSYSSWSSDFYITNNFVAGVNTLDFISFNEGDGDNPAGFRAKVSGTAAPILSTSTTLKNNLATGYFRTPFTLNAAPQNAAMTISGYWMDGAVFYLNGTEVLRLNMPSGTILSNTPAVTNVSTPTYFGPFTLPNTAMIKGQNVLAVEVHRAASGTNLFFGADLSLTVTNKLQPDPFPLGFNEFSDPKGKDGWIELINTGTSTINPQGCTLVRQRSGSTNLQYTITAQSLEPGAMLSLPKATLGFGLDSGDVFFLYNAAQDCVLDAVSVPGHPISRYPDGSGKWFSTTTSTPGASNQVVFHNEIVINEIMYNPPTGQSQNGTWIELYNRSGGSVDIGNWSLAKDIDYTFPQGTIIPAGGYLVVAGNLGWMQTNYPSVTAVGPFANSLKHREGHIQLQDANGNPANDVHYFGKAPWPAYANGGGASLELRNPWADNSKPEAWAASDESVNSIWTNISYTASASQSLGPSLWNEFQMGLLDAGECLIDDLHAVESPTSSPIELLQNGTFENGLTAWRLLGDHGSSYVEKVAGSSVLHLIATDATDHMHNHLETTIANSRYISDGKIYKISYRAKWLAGNNRLNTRLYFNRLAKTTALPIPTQHGTPGSANTRYTANPGPTFSNLSHSPITPKSSEAVTVSVAVSDPQGLSSVKLYWAANGGSWQNVTMLPVSASDASGYTNYTAQIPTQTSGSLVQFYVQATDSQGGSASMPSAGTNSRALYRVNDTKTQFAVHQLRILMPSADANYLHQPTNVMSNARIGATLVYDDAEVFYNAGIHLQSSERGRDQTGRAGFSIALPSDHMFRGVYDSITVDRSGGWSGLGGRQDEILLWQAVNHAGGMPGLYNDLVQCYAPRSQEDGFGMLRLGAFDAQYFDSQYDNGGDGSKFKLELIYYPTTTVTGDVQAPKLPEPDDVINFDLQDWGSDKENYRWIFLQENNADTDDYSQIIALNKAFSQSGATLETQMNQLMDVDEYLRVLAFKAFTGDADTYTYGYNHNFLIYFRPDTGKAMGLLWDMDYAYCSSIDNSFPGTASANTYKFVTRPTYLRMYYNHLLDIATTSVNSTYLKSWGAHYSGLLGQDWSGEVNYLQNRSAYILSKIPVTTSIPFAITSNSGRGFAIGANYVVLQGISPLTVKSIQVNGASYTTSWTSMTNWSVMVPLPLQINNLTFQGIDNQGNPMTNAMDTVTITNTLSTTAKYVTINEWMADNGGPGGFLDTGTNLYSDWLELYNPNNVNVDLSGCYLTDDLTSPTKWQIPSGTSIAPGSFMLVWADKLTNLNATASNMVLHANFKLSKSGSGLGLYGSDLTPWHLLTFGAQTQNTSQGLYPDGNTNAVISMTNWTPGAPNQNGLPPSPTLSLTTLGTDGTLSFTLTTAPNRACRVEYKNDLNEAQWTPLSTNRFDNTTTIVIQDNLGTQPHRFYRAALLP